MLTTLEKDKLILCNMLLLTRLSFADMLLEKKAAHFTPDTKLNVYHGSDDKSSCVCNETVAGIMGIVTTFVLSTSDVTSVDCLPR